MACGEVHTVTWLFAKQLAVATPPLLSRIASGILATSISSFVVLGFLGALGAVGWGTDAEDAARAGIGGLRKKRTAGGMTTLSPAFLGFTRAEVPEEAPYAFLG